MTENLPLSKRPFDFFFIIMFSLFFITCVISDEIPAIYGTLYPSGTNIFMQWNYDYAIGCDPLYLAAPVWMRFVTGLSAFVYGPFYMVLVASFIRGWNRVQVPAVMYGSVISFITGVVVFGVEFFGEPQYRCQNPAKFLPLNLPYVLVPLLLIVRMRKELPFTRKF